MALRRPPEARFWEHVIVDDGNGTCWPWGGSKTPQGYGIFCPGGRQKTARAHRWAYETFVGPISPGLVLDHLCRNPSCVNPAHLEPVTNRENVLRGFAARERQSHCRHGHEFTTQNTYITPRGVRHCRACCRRRMKDLRRRKREAMQAIRGTEES